MLYMLICFTGKAMGTRILQLDKHNEIIRIAQFADLHFGEDLKKDRLTLQLMRSVVKKESPDFAVFTGDQVAGYNAFSSQEKLLLWERALSVMAEFHIPFATIFGNHDDQSYKLDLLLCNTWAYYVLYTELVVCILLCVFMQRKGRRNIPTEGCVLFFMIIISMGCIYASMPSHDVRRSLVTHEHQVYPTLSYTDIGPEDVNGVSNYRVIIKLKATGQSLPLFFMDSGGGMTEIAIHSNQLQWLSTFEQNTEQATTALAFIHVAPVQYHSMFFNHKCQGSIPKESVNTCPGSERLLNTLYTRGVRALFVGHDHGNEWCCSKDNMLLCYGKHSGFGGYDFNETVRGVRIIDVNASSGAISTYISFWDSTNRGQWD